MSAPHAHVEPTQEAGRLLRQSVSAGPTVMLNLLRFRKVADYSSYLELAPIMPIRGSEAFDRCVRHTLSNRHEGSGDVLPLSEMPFPLCPHGATS